MKNLSVLDLSPVPAGASVGQALKNSIELAQHLDNLGYERVWYAEHHNMKGIASAATSVLMGQVLAATRNIIVGSGGVMLPNHAPLVIAEQFGTLAALYPGRVELGLGRAPGTDQMTAQALRRNLDSDPNQFPRDVVELMHYFNDPEPNQRLLAVPGYGLHVPVWILGSSLFGAQLAAILGLPYSFASHFAPAELERAMKLYREQFAPSDTLQQPKAMAALNIVLADTQEEAEYLFSSQQQAFVNLRTGAPGELPAPQAGYMDSLDPRARMILDQSLSCSVVTTPGKAAEQLRAIKDQCQADELIVTTPVHDPEARKYSFSLLREIIEDI